MNTLLEKVKANLILGHSVDDELLLMNISAAVSYRSQPWTCTHWMRMSSASSFSTG